MSPAVNKMLMHFLTGRKAGPVLVVQSPLVCVARLRRSISRFARREMKTGHPFTETSCRTKATTCHTIVACRPAQANKPRCQTTYAKETSMKTRDDYVAEMKVKLDVWNAAIDELEAKTRKRKAQATEDLTAQVNELKSKRDEVKNKLQEIQSASEDAWERLETGTQRIWEDMKQTFEETTKALS
jgi:septal ring factor EnvC (AmiA/AmiB activator)